MAKKMRSWKEVTTIHSFRDSKTVRVFGIARVSTDKQAKKIGESLDHQKEVLANWVKSKSSLHAPQEWKLVQVFVENEEQDGKRKGRTATKRENRKGLAKALELAKLRLVDVVLVTKLDRIARNVRDYIDISAEFNDNEVALVCLDLDIDTSTPDGQMIMRNHANLAQWQAERIAQYSIETVQRHVSQGRPIGPPPVGYRKCKDENDKTTFEPDPVYKKHVQFMDKIYLRIKSVGKIVDALHNKGFKSPRGRTYSKPQVSRILQNIRYTGRQGHEGKIYDGNWEPLRSLDLHNTIQNIFKQNRKTNHSPNSSNKNYVYLAKSLLKCSNCGSSMIARPATGRGGKYYPYYMCMKAFKTNGIDCNEMNYLAAEAVDNAIISVLRHLRLNPRIVADIVKGANQTTASTISTLENDLEQVQINLKNSRTKISNLVEILAEKGISGLDAVKEKLENLNQEEAELAVEEKRLKEEIQAEKIQAGTAHDYIKTLQLFNDFCVMNENNKERIQAIMPRIINSVICHITDKKRGIGKLKIGLFGRPFDRGQNAELWNNTLQKIADECYNKKILKEINGKFASKPHSKKQDKAEEASLKNTSSSPLAYSDKRYYATGFAGGKSCYPIYNPHANQDFLEPHSPEDLKLSDGESIDFEPSEMLEFTKYIQRYSSVTPRTYVFEFPFYTIISNARQRFCLGTRPEDLDHIITIERKALERHQAHLNRLERFPLDKAEYYLRLKESQGVNSVRGLSKVTGEDWSYIAKIIRTLELPDSIKDFLRSNKSDPAILSFFHLRKLLDIVRQGEERLQLSRFRELMQELEEGNAVVTRG